MHKADQGPQLCSASRVGHIEIKFEERVWHWGLCIGNVGECIHNTAVLTTAQILGGDDELLIIDHRLHRHNSGKGADIRSNDVMRSLDIKGRASWQVDFTQLFIHHQQRLTYISRFYHGLYCFRHLQGRFLGLLLIVSLTVHQILFAIILPPLGVFFERGCGADLVGFVQTFLTDSDCFLAHQHPVDYSRLDVSCLTRCCRTLYSCRLLVRASSTVRRLALSYGRHLTF